MAWIVMWAWRVEEDVAATAEEAIAAAQAGQCTSLGWVVQHQKDDPPKSSAH
jgi:hypothetical protein